ncbi:HAM-2, protein required for hyphal anastomosis [Lasiosphaeria hispida]|uniref:HAM-2, protein required for hyphal anastomosis n=1 Tax=Lasiosphaeria hispida TaxID=260671 RepID=A0AAJ0MI68_9PEZI|nr:HAM-2, protein required for hyphal anastomosis [Lasiosphaeria hispida]
MNSLWSSRVAGDGSAAPPKFSDPAETTIEDVEPTLSDAATRPPLPRASQPPPPAVPPPPPSFAPPPPVGNPPMVPAPLGPPSQGPPNAAGPNPPDSLSLAQLRRIVAEFPRTEPIAYDYVYADMGPIEEEIDEWFMYNFWQWVRLNAANRAFHSAWGKAFTQEEDWEDVDAAARRGFVKAALEGVKVKDRAARGEAVGTLVYLVLGRWTETVRNATLPGVADAKVKSAATKVQLDAMKDGVQLLSDCGGIPIVWGALRDAFEPFWSDELPQNLQLQAEELIHLMTIMYIAVQEVLDDPEEMESVQQELLALDPNLVHFMLHATAKLRWDDAYVLPQTQVFLLFWKSILVVFGGSKDIAETKKAVNESQGDDKEKETITASPLDYHVFRQEITSKYPAYIPPRPVIPLEAEQTSLLPQLHHQPTRSNAANGILPGPSGQSGGASILHQPVHIATPAPSPPPSPSVGGKGGKKQNYQTNQNFPFMYPPLDASSNSAGGKGGAGLQDLLVGRRWEGSDVPASILEAGELFSKRVRMTRTMRQLWDEREKFLKFERGWDGADDDIVDELDLSSLTLEEKEELGLNKPAGGDEEKKGSDAEVDYGPRGVNQRTKERLDAVEEFYKEALPHLQSLVIVLLKAIVAIASNLIPPGQNGQQQPPLPSQNNGRMNGGPPQGRPQDAPNGLHGTGKGDLASPSDSDVDEARSREIGAKAVTGIMILLLKWLKISHVLKFEYMTQLLLDSNYLPLVLKLFALHDIQQVVESKTDRIEQSFFYFCGSRAGVIPPGGIPNPTSTEFEDDSDDEAAPPPIKRRRSPTEPDIAQGSSPPNVPAGMGTASPPSVSRPEVDELGYPVNPLPKEPITDFSRRNFFALINYLRVMQKICKHKAHRNLLMVQYKSSGILRKSLKVPQQELRLYTLKLFKNQVPYCGRKWRQSNMRVITAVYLHCRPELRDEWLAGSDVDAEVEEALPLEQALRSLTHWFNMRKYPDKMAAEVRAALREEQDFFVRELDKVDLNWAEVEGDDASVRLDWEHDGGW